MAFPTTSILDNFNRADEGPPPSASWAGPLITANGGQLKVGTNQCVTSGAAPASDYWTTDFGSDQEAYVTVPTFASTYVGLYLRVLNPTATNITGYSVYFYQAGFATNAIKVFRWDNSSTVTQLGSTITQTITDGDSIGASMVGSLLTVYYKVGAGAWTSVGSATDATYGTSGKIALETATGSADDFGGGTIAANAVLPYFGSDHSPYRVIKRVVSY